MSAAENLMTANPDLTAIYATGEPALLGAVAAVESQGRQADVKIVGWDLTASAIKGIDDGYVVGVVQQDPAGMGAAAVEAAFKAITSRRTVDRRPSRCRSPSSPRRMSSPTGPSSNNARRRTGRPRGRRRRRASGLRGISKRFGSIEALRGVDLELFPGEVLGLVGDNAAGKSTLTKIIAGAYVPDAGTIELDGTIVASPRPAEARAKQIEMVYQDLSLCDTIDVAGNLFLGREPRRSRAGPPTARQAADDRGGQAPPRRAGDPHPQSAGAGGPALRRPAAVDRDRPGRRLRAARPDHGRADLRAGRGRGRGRAAPDPPPGATRRRDRS